MKLLIKILLPVLVLLLCVITARVVIANRPEPAKRPQFKPTSSIEATRVSKSDYPVILRTQGTVGAARQGSLVPEVAGSIVSVADRFVVGGSFRRGDILLQIDSRDYEIAVTLAEATYAQAAATLSEEKARSSQASADWRRLGRSGKPSALMLRQPQLAAARASLEGAQAQVNRAKLDLQRTKIIAPYDGQLRSKSVDVGQYVNKGSLLGEIYSIDTAEIRLPLNNRQLGFIDLPTQTPYAHSPVQISASIGATLHHWSGKVVRTEGAIDTNSRQLYAVAQIANPYASGDKQHQPLRLGQYVQARVTGRVLKGVFVIPRSALREDREVLVVDDLNTLQARDVTVQWKDAEIAVISDGLVDGEVISLTTLGSVTNGTRVRATIDGTPPPVENNARASGQGATGNSAQTDREKRLQKLKALIDAGGDIPAPARQRIEARIASGQPVPDWLRAHMASATKSQ